MKWKDGIVTWTYLKDLKESNPIKLTEYVTAWNIQDEPYFAWWAPFTLRKQDRIIAAVNSCVRKVTHKYGIDIPTSVEHADEIDKRNQNTFLARCNQFVNVENWHSIQDPRARGQSSSRTQEVKYTHDIYSQYGLHQKILMGQEQT